MGGEAVWSLVRSRNLLFTFLELIREVDAAGAGVSGTSRLPNKWAGTLSRAASSASIVVKDRMYATSGGFRDQRLSWLRRIRRRGEGGVGEGRSEGVEGLYEYLVGSFGGGRTRGRDGEQGRSK